MNFPKPTKSVLLMCGVAAISLLYNLIGIGWGLPALWYPDEPETIEQIVIPMARHFDPNPHIFHKGSLYYYFLIVVLSPFFAFLKLFHVSSENYGRLVAQVALIARIATACVGAFGVTVMVRIGKRIAGSRAGIAAAFLLAVNILYAGYAHFAYMEVPMLVLLMGSLLLALRYTDTGKARDLRFSAFIGGLAVSAKFNAALPIVVFLLILHLDRTRRGTKFRAKCGLFFSRELFTSFGLMVLGFVAGTPFAVLDFKTFTSYFIKQSIIAREGYKVFVSSASWGANLQLLIKGLGVPVAAAAFGAYLYAFIRWFKDRKVKAACILFPPLFYYIYTGSMSLAAIRYLLPMVPFMILSLTLVELQRFRKSVRTAVLTLFVLVGVHAAVSSFLGVSEFRTDIRYSAEKWISENIPQGAKVEMYAYKTYLPKFPEGIAAYRMTPNFVVESAGYEAFKRNGFAGKYLPDAAPSAVSQGKGEPDNREAFTLTALRARNPDYIVLSSFYDDRYLPSKTNKTNEMYPQLAQYYMALISGRSGYDTVAVFKKNRMQEFYVNPAITVLKRMQ
jgi:hypothetical protein